MRYSVIGATAQQVKSTGGTDIKEARHSKIIFATLTVEQSKRLSALGCNVNLIGTVKADVMPPVVTPPTPVAGIPTYTPQELVVALGFDEIRAITDPPLYGEGFNLAIIDSGIRETHQMVNGRVIYSKNFTSDPMEDGLSHGTGVCNIVLAMAPLCSILNLKVLNSKGEGNEEDVVLAIDHCVDLQSSNPVIAPSAINLSLGAPDDGNPNNILRVACRTAIDNGIWVSASAGNAGPSPTTITSPACEQYVFAVGSVNVEPFGISPWSSRGPTVEGLVKPDVTFFGENIEMADSGSDTATTAKSGTSFAAPFCAGIGILYLEAILKYRGVEFVAGAPPGLYEEYVPLLTMEQIIDDYLFALCVKPQGTIRVKDNEYGYGVPLGPLFAQSIIRPVVFDISSIMPFAIGMVGISILGMMVSGMTKGLVVK